MGDFHGRTVSFREGTLPSNAIAKFTMTSLLQTSQHSSWIGLVLSSRSLTFERKKTLYMLKGESSGPYLNIGSQWILEVKNRFPSER